MGTFADAGSLIVETLFGIVMFVLLMRILLQAVRANFYNPICQSLFKITNPVLMPVQKVIPVWKGIHFGGIMLAWLLASIWMFALLAMRGTSVSAPALVVLGLGKLLYFFLGMMFWITIVRVLMSWISPDPRSPIVPLLVQVTDLVMRPFQRVIPPLGGLDISPIFALLALQLAQILLVRPLMNIGMSLA